MSDNATYAYNYFLPEYGSAGSAAIVGNLFGESGLNPNAVGDNGTALGIAQWRGSRQPSWLRGSSLNDQLAYVDYELKNNYVNVGNFLKNSTDVSASTKMFMQGYEKPANMSSFGDRLNAATSVLGKAGGLISGIKNALSNPMGSIADTIGIGGITNGLGITGDCNYICQFRNWLSESHFWRRVAIVVLSLIVIGGALYLLANRSSK